MMGGYLQGGKLVIDKPQISFNTREENFIRNGFFTLYCI
jgi:hypothetical protein